MRATLYVDDAVGERRRLLATEDGAPFRLHLDRWSEAGSRARVDEVWLARVGAPLAGGRGRYAGLGAGPDAVLETSSASLHEGQLVGVRVKAEARAGKGPVVSLHALPAGALEGARPGFHLEAPADPFLAGVTVVDTLEGEPARREVDLAIEAVSSPVSFITGGGRLTLETTTALTAIDIDAAGRSGGQNEQFAASLNTAAALEAARQISLRGLAGLFVVDFVTLKTPAVRRDVADSFRTALKAFLGRRSDVLEISALGLCEASVSRRMRGAGEALADTPGPEREALNLLRVLESAGRSDRGARLRARVSASADLWLRETSIGWREALANRIGERWMLETVPDGGDRLGVWSEA